MDDAIYRALQKSTSNLDAAGPGTAYVIPSDMIKASGMEIDDFAAAMPKPTRAHTITVDTDANNIMVSINAASERTTGMTPDEFHSWFAGFAAACTKVPTKAQWETIKSNAASVLTKDQRMRMALEMEMERTRVVAQMNAREPVPYQYAFDEDGVTVCTPYGTHKYSDDDPKN